MAARHSTQDGELTDLTLACKLFEYAVTDRDARIATLETQAGQAYTDIAAMEERETDLLVELSKAREERQKLLLVAYEACELLGEVFEFDAIVSEETVGDLDKAVCRLGTNWLAVKWWITEALGGMAQTLKARQE